MHSASLDNNKTTRELNELADLLLRHAYLAKEKLNRSNLTKLIEYSERLKSNKSKRELIALIQAIANFISTIYKKSFKSEFDSNVIDLLPTLVDNESDVTEKLSRIKSYLNSLHQNIQKDLAKKEIFSVLVLGDDNKGVGKTSLITQFIHHKFTLVTRSSSATDIHDCDFTIGDKHVTLSIQDYVGFSAKRLDRMYPENIHGIILAVDLTRHFSFVYIQKIIKEIFQINGREYLNKIVLVGTKSDSDDLREDLKKAIQEYAATLGCRYIETSAKYNENIDLVFQHLITKAVQQKEVNNVEHAGRVFNAQDNARLRALFNDKIWNNLTSTFARQPAGFQKIIKYLGSNQHGNQNAGDILAALKDIASRHADETVTSSYFFFPKIPRNPTLLSAYRGIMNADSLEQAESEIIKIRLELAGTLNLKNRFK